MEDDFLICPQCNEPKSIVTDSRGRDATDESPLPGRYRRRKCLSCGKRWTTAEVSVDALIGMINDMKKKLIKETIEHIKGMK